MGETSEECLHHHEITASRGFLPERDPLVAFDTEQHPDEIGSYLASLDSLGEQLPELLESGECRLAVEAIESPPPGLIKQLSEREIHRLCLLAGFAASGYANQIGSSPVDRLPEGIAVPLYRSSEYLGRKPVLSYDMIALQNFRRRDTDRGFELGNLDTIQEFTTLSDERWFVIVHVAIEAAAGDGLVAIAKAQRGVREDDPRTVRESLNTVTASMDRQTEIMARMTEGNDPAVFATEFRPYYNGLDEVVFEGVDALDGEPQTLRGGSGAQSCVLPSLDAALGIEHESTVLLEKLLDMRTYMPAPHRAVIDAFEEDVDIRSYVDSHRNESLRESFNECIEALQQFREVHFGQVIKYIRAQTGDTTGTGGTDYMEFLGQMTDETADHTV